MSDDDPLEEADVGFDASSTLEDLAGQISSLVRGGSIDEAITRVTDLHPADVAEVLGALADDDLPAVIDHLEVDRAAAILEELDPDRRRGIAERIAPSKLADILELMPPDEAADFLQGVDAEVRAVIIGRMEREEAFDVAELLHFPEDSAGRRMSQDYFAVGEQMSAHEVIGKLREVPEDVELVYYVYVLGGSEQLKGVVSLRDLIAAPDQTPVGELMQTQIETVSPTDDIESVVDVVRRYNLLAVPVVDELGRLLGIVTVDDVMEAIEQEAGEDVLRFAGSFESDESGLRRTWPAVRRRLPWLAIATMIELGIAFVLLRPLPKPLLVITIAYIPLLVFVGGNTAVQAAARVLVTLVSGKTESWSPWRQASRELEAGLILGALAAGASFPILVALGQGVRFAAVVAPAVGITVVIGAGLGALLPVALHRMRLDPSIASGPLLGSAMDLVSVFVYVRLALTFYGYMV